MEQCTAALEEIVEAPDNDDRFTGKSELRLALVGKTGCGKSAAGNCILDKKGFVSKLAAVSVTTKCEVGRRRLNERDILVVDTPGLFDTKVPVYETAEEITRCVLLSSPGLHAIILVMQLGRFTQEEKDTIAKIQEIFGQNAMKYMIFLFTRCDDLEDQTLEKYMEKGADKSLKDLIAKCGNRFCGFNNRACGDEKNVQTSKLVALIDEMVEQNGGKCYYNSMYVFMEKLLQDKTEAWEKYYKEKLDQEKKEITNRYKKKCEEREKESRQKERELMGDLKQPRIQQEIKELMRKIEEKWREGMESQKQEELREKEKEYKSKMKESRQKAENDGAIITTFLRKFAFISAKVENWFRW